MRILPPAPSHLFRVSAVSALLAVLGCDASFDPIAETDRTLSVFGHLDATMDTQWIRVLPLRPLLLTTREPLGLEVVLEALGSGKRITLRDSVFSYQRAPTLASDSVFIHNFWTADRIEHGERYRFSVTGREGISTSTEVPIPEDYAVAVVLNTRPGTNAEPANDLRYDAVRLTGADTLAFVRVLAHLRNGCGPYVYPIDYPIPEGISDPLTIPVRKNVPGPLNVTPGHCGGDGNLEKLEIWVVVTGSPWPAGQEFAEGALAVTELPSNLPNAFGFLGGVVTKTVPYESCSWAGRAPLPPTCELSYEGHKASLTGTIRGECGTLGLANGTIRLEEILADPAAPRKVRTAQSRVSLGAYEIAGLEAGVRYALSASHPQPSDLEGIRRYTTRFDTVSFAPGERATYDVTLPLNREEGAKCS